MGLMSDRTQRYIIRIIAGFCTITLVLGASCAVCRADEYEDKLTEMQNQEQQTQDMITNLEKQTKATRDSINMLQEQKKETENTVNALKGQSDVLKSEIEGYSGKLDALDGEIEKAEGEMARVSAEIVSLNSELDEIRQNLNDKQDLLGKRIKNVYEKGGSKGMVRSILEAGTFTAILTRYEYANAMIRYDRQKIAECQELKKQIEDKIAKVEEKEAELDAYQDDLDEKYSELESITDEVQGKLDLTNSSLSAETGKLRDFDTKLAELDKTMKSLESQTAAAQAQLAKQVAERLALKKEDTSGSYSASGSELEWLAATIQAEAGGESYTGKLAVGSVIMNRVKSSAFPNDIKSVITQNMQFASYRSGKVELIIANGPNSTCVSAAQEVLNGARVGDYLFFMTKYYADYYRISEYTMIGNHAFFYKWTTKEKEAVQPVEQQEEQSEEPASEEQQTSDESSDEATDEGSDEGSDEGDDSEEE